MKFLPLAHMKKWWLFQYVMPMAVFSQKYKQKSQISAQFIIIPAHPFKFTPHH